MSAALQATNEPLVLRGGEGAVAVLTLHLRRFAAIAEGYALSRTATHDACIP